ncbi:hypothetical protein [Microbacterium sp. UBA837]|uniref:hypothetical protein n=1 Tax=uncultured Microbacterium sp. TaxID=191216 RepID=UPI0025CBAA45|nr:hypothetical protein [Microbacterium sp. UBA837]
MAERRGVQHPLPLVQIETERRVDPHPHDAVLVEERALGPAGRARGVDDERVVVLGDLDIERVPGLRGRRCEHVVEIVRLPQREGRYAARPLLLCLPSADVRDELGSEQEQPRSGVRDEVVDFGWRGARIDGHDDGPEPEPGEERDDEGIAVPREQRDPVALAQAVPSQLAR